MYVTKDDMVNRSQVGRLFARVARSGSMWYYALAAASGILGLIKGVLLARLLGDEAFGYYAFGLLFSCYAEYFLHFGLYRGLECMLPGVYGSGRTAEADELRNRTAGCILLISIVVLTVIGLACLAPFALDGTLRLIIFLSGLLSATNLFYGLGQQDLRSQKRNVTSAVLSFTRAVLGTLVGVLVALVIGSPGVILAEVLLGLAIFAFQIRFICPTFRFSFTGFGSLKHVFSVGRPLMLRNIANDLSLNLDRWCITLVFGFALFGQYAIAMLLATCGMIVYTAIWNYVGPRAAHAYGKDGDLQAFLDILHRNSILILLAFVALWLPFQYVTVHWVPYVFPDKPQVVEILPVIYWGVLFQILQQYDWIAMVVRRTSALFVMSFIVASFTAGLYGLAVTQKWSLVAFAWIYVTGRALTTAGQFFLAVWLAGGMKVKTLAQGRATCGG